MNETLHIKNLDSEFLTKYFKNNGLPTYRAEQVLDAVFSARISNWDEATTLPKSLREELSKQFHINSISTWEIKKSSDGTSKFLFGFRNSSSVESVLIPEFDFDEENKLIRNTLCVSSQVGCALDCAFCATGKLKFGRNLEPGEIIDQVLFAEKLTGEKITNIVFMGMGEPLQNYDNVIKAVDIISNPERLIVPRKRITISTSGIVPKIFELSKEKKPIKLAVSLHATTNGLREKLMPIAKRWRIDELRKAITEYYRLTGIPVTYEYILFDSLNDREEDAKRLAKFVRTCPSKVNIIPFHSISFTNPQGIAAELKPSSPERIKEFSSMLKKQGVNVFVRNSAGFDIDAACGQLAYSVRNQ